MIIPLFGGSAVAKVSVQVSEYSERNGGYDNGALFAVEVLFPDGKWVVMGYHKVLSAARQHAREEAEARAADLLSVSLWPGGDPVPDMDQED